MGRSAKVSRMGMPAFEKNKKLTKQSSQPASATIKKTVPKDKAKKKKAPAAVGGRGTPKKV